MNTDEFKNLLRDVAVEMSRLPERAISPEVFLRLLDDFLSVQGELSDVIRTDLLIKRWPSPDTVLVFRDGKLCWAQSTDFKYEGKLEECK